MKWQASAPSNIALIKYMGKIANSGNVSTNPSISYTLDHLRTFIELEKKNGDDDTWEPLSVKNQQTPKISSDGQRRFLKHLEFLKSTWGYKGSFIVRSHNNFPSDCGLASSASSFAALTLGAYLAVKDLKPGLDLTSESLANLSRQGSGSSCRSFFTPWSVWDDSGARGVELPYKNLLHQVVVVNDQIKKVSSSEAHKKISSSMLAQGRTDRAVRRLENLMTSIKQQDWQKSYQIIWAEFWDMHALFETSEPPFGYMSSGSLQALRSAEELWQRKGDGPWITMDAGPNVHLLYRQDQKDIAAQLQKDLSKTFQVISNFE